jgi:hypothetical protein
MAVFEKLGGEARLGHLRSGVAKAVANAAERIPSDFVVACSEVFAGTAANPAARAEVVRTIGRVARTSSAHTNDCLPLVYTAMLGDDQGVRAAGIEAAEEILRSLPHESIPPVLAEAVTAGLGDPYLVVVRAAIKGMDRVPPDLVDQRAVTTRLLGAAAAYANDRIRDRMVQDALRAANRLSRDDPEWHRRVRS